MTDDSEITGLCVSCGKPTDTLLAFKGDAEWTLAALMTLGLSEESAIHTANQAWKSPPGKVPAGEVTTFIQVCRECVRKCPTDFPDPVLALPGAEVHPIVPKREK